MAKVRQLADLFLRGALANETMKNLTVKEKELADRVCDQVMNHDVLMGHKNMFMTKLGTTIRGDFTDRLMAQQEYRITIWRGVIYLLYHRKYSFRCRACDATTYQSQRGAPIEFDRRWDCCPACRSYTINDPGESGLEAGSFITNTDYETLMLDLTNHGQQVPTVQSCIEPIPGEKKVTNPAQILDDPAQIKKFFGEFIWNYFRQSIKENKISYHGKQNHKLIGPLDTVAVQYVIQLLKVSKTNFQCDPFSPVDGYFIIYCQPYGLDPEVIGGLHDLQDFVQSYGGELKIDNDSGRFDETEEKVGTPSYFDNAILVKDLYGSAPFVELDITINDRVQMVTNSVSKDKDNNQDIIQQVEKPNMNHDIREFEQSDTISVLRESLPEGDCRAVLDLITNQGETFNRFVEIYPNDIMTNHGIPRQNRMAEFLGISQKQVKTYRETIHIQAVAHGIGN